MPALLGRVITPEDGKPGAPAVFVMAYKMWQRRFHLDPSILGRTFVLNGKPSKLVGIMPKRFTKRGADLWQPAEPDPTDKNQRFVLQAWLKPGVTLAAGRGGPPADRATLGERSPEGLSEALLGRGDRLCG